MPHNAVQMMMDAKALCGFWWFLQIESKCKVAREKGMSFSVWQALKTRVEMSGKCPYMWLFRVGLRDAKLVQPNKNHLHFAKHVHK